ncbi:hypothetical protein KKC60_02545 [Patescibacteria group bacterium]|nr:hypothetical protein [Patescibacteria group bacterium]
MKKPCYFLPLLILALISNSLAIWLSFKSEIEILIILFSTGTALVYLTIIVLFLRQRMELDYQKKKNYIYLTLGLISSVGWFITHQHTKADKIASKELKSINMLVALRDQAIELNRKLEQTPKKVTLKKAQEMLWSTFSYIDFNLEFEHLQDRLRGK